jgi:hypothetical protein
MKVRCYEYNWLCALMKKDAPTFQDPQLKAWRLVPDEEIHYGDTAAAAAKEARALLGGSSPPTRAPHGLSGPNAS